MKSTLLGIVFLTFATLIYCESCQTIQNCVRADASVDYNYVSCINNTCVCVGNGFSGSGTSTDPCRCDGQVYWGNEIIYCFNCTAPAKVIYADGTPYCINLQQCESSDSQLVHQEGVVRQLYENLIYPMPLLIIETPALIQELFSPNISGRITPVGIFDDLEGTIEYFYALSASTGGKVQSIDVVDIITQGSTVASRVDILFNATDVTGPHYYNLTQTGFFHFDDEGRILEYDLTILRLGKYADPVVTSNETLYKEEICEVAQLYCLGNNTQYNSTESCLEFLSSIPFGSFNDAMSDSVVCRIVHTILVPFRPDIHCPHVGPTGGQMCVNFTYQSWYSEPYY